MPKGSLELTNARKEEIVNACEKLYQTMSFKEITLKEIAEATTFTRTSIYNYFQTKEEIFMELLKREYEEWIAEMQTILENNTSLTKEQFAEKIATSLAHRKQLLKIMTMNMYDMEEHSRLENLVAFKEMYGKAMKAMQACIDKFFPASTKEERQIFMYQFFPFMYGIYPYTEATEKQREAMKMAGIVYLNPTIYELTYRCMVQLLVALDHK